MIQEAKHSPIPWKACKNGECSCGQIWCLPGDMPVYTVLPDGKRQIMGLACNEWGDAPDMIYGAVGKEEQKANAAFIVEAVNNHELLKESNAEMLEALKEVHCFIVEGNQHNLELRNELCEQARAAIAKATGGAA